MDSRFCATAYQLYFGRRWTSASDTLCELHRLQSVLQAMLILEIEEMKHYQRLCTAELVELKLWADQDEPAQYSTRRGMLCDSLAQEILLSGKLLSDALRRLQHLQDFSLTHKNNAWWSKNQILVSSTIACSKHRSTRSSVIRRHFARIADKWAI
jgi:hypothetical protein